MRKNESESKLQSRCIDYLLLKESQGLLWFTRLNTSPSVIHTPKGMVFRRMGKGAKKGIPDLLVFVNKQTIWIELKSKTGKLSEYQKVFWNSMKTHSDGVFLLIKEFDFFKSMIEYLLNVKE